MKREIAIVLGAIVLAVGIAAAGWIGGNAFVRGRTPPATVTVRGLAERDVRADLAFWPLKYQATGATLAEARTALDAQTGDVTAFLAAQGFAETDYSLQSLTVEDRFAQNYGQLPPGEVRFLLTQVVLLRSGDVDRVAAAAQSIGDLLAQNVLLTSSPYETGPFYQFTGLNVLKPEMLIEATQRAREVADQFAAETGTTVGAIRDANQGVFEIAATVSIPNDNDDRQIDKRVRVVSTITYFLED